MAMTFEYKNSCAVAGYPLRTETAKIMSGAGILEKNTLIGKVTRGEPTFSVVPAGTNTGNGTLSDVVLGSFNLIGEYVLECVTVTEDTTTFQVLSPNGFVMPNALVGVLYVNPRISFKIVAGETAFVAGDKITINIQETAGSGEYKKAVFGAKDGSADYENLRILLSKVDATTAAVNCNVYIEGVFDLKRVVLDTSFFNDGIVRDELINGLRSYNILLRNDVGEA